MLLIVASVLIVGLSMGAMAVGMLLRGRPLGGGCTTAAGCDACRRPGKEDPWTRN